MPPLLSLQVPLLALSPYKRPLKQLGPGNHMHMLAGGAGARPGRDGFAAAARERAAFGGGSDCRVHGTTPSRIASHSVHKLPSVSRGCSFSIA